MQIVDFGQIETLQFALQSTIFVVLTEYLSLSISAGCQNFDSIVEVIHPQPNRGREAE
jgi:hypothetical protein